VPLPTSPTSSATPRRTCPRTRGTITLPVCLFVFYADNDNDDNIGACDQQTLKDNVDAFQRIRLRPRTMVPVSRIDMTTTILGSPIASPIVVAPTAFQRMAHPEGELATARAAADRNTLMTLSSWATTSIEDVAEAAPNGLRWFQLYVYNDREMTAAVVRRAEKAGFKALALTVDAPVLGRRVR